MSLTFNQVSKQLDSTDTLTFGKYYMSKIDDVLINDPTYLAYLITNTNLNFSEYVKQEAMRRSMPKIRSYLGGSFDDIHYETQLQFEDVPF